MLMWFKTRAGDDAPPTLACTAEGTYHMPAPALVLTRGNITYTADPVEKDGFRINASLSSPAEGANWALSVSTQLVDAAVVDDNDEAARFTASSLTVPFNEAPDLASATAKLQALVDLVFDQFIPAQASI
jgi:hypothetical protein